MVCVSKLPNERVSWVGKGWLYWGRGLQIAKFRNCKSLRRGQTKKIYAYHQKSKLCTQTKYTDIYIYCICIARATVCRYNTLDEKANFEMCGGSSLVTVIYTPIYIFCEGIRCLMCCDTVLREISHLQEKTIIRY